jgi:hypothetical protein
MFGDSQPPFRILCGKHEPRNGLVDKVAGEAAMRRRTAQTVLLLHYLRRIHLETDQVIMFLVHGNVIEISFVLEGLFRRRTLWLVANGTVPGKLSHAVFEWPKCE